MNPDRIYRQYRDDALARQFTAEKYTTFVAMPFRDQYSYHSREVFEKVICSAAARATERNEAARPFAIPFRVDDLAGVAGVITEDIVVGILESHFFLGDLTFSNGGVLVETGTALGLKPNGQIILIMQGDLRDLHFDIRNNRVLSYDSRNPVDATEQIATAFIAAARAFEDDRERYVESVTRSLSSDAISCLKYYGVLQKRHPRERRSLHRRVVDEAYESGFPLFPDAAVFPHAVVLFTDAARELIEKRLLWTDYQVGATPEGNDAFGMHATDLGWLVIERLWPELRRPSTSASVLSTT
jgi:hypothetical protein